VTVSEFKMLLIGHKTLPGVHAVVEINAGSGSQVSTGLGSNRNARVFFVRIGNESLNVWNPGSFRELIAVTVVKKVTLLVEGDYRSETRVGELKRKVNIATELFFS